LEGKQVVDPVVDKQDLRSFAVQLAQNVMVDLLFRLAPEVVGANVKDPLEQVSDLEILEDAQGMFLRSIRQD